MHKVLYMASAVCITPLKGVSKQDKHLGKDTKAEIKHQLLGTEGDKWMVFPMSARNKNKGIE